MNEVNIVLTKDEITLISNGILSLIHNASTAKSLVNDNKTLSAIEDEIATLISLNNRFCKYMD